MRHTASGLRKGIAGKSAASGGLERSRVNEAAVTEAME